LEYLGISVENPYFLNIIFAYFPYSTNKYYDGILGFGKTNK
jgi:hypothetical protein